MKIFTDTKVCEDCGTEMTVYSDGQRVYAQCGKLFCSSEGYRELVTLSVRCGYTNINTDEICGHLVEFNLTDSVWVEATPEMLSQMNYAEKIEVYS